MFRKRPSLAFLSAFNPSVCRSLVEALDQAYSDACELHRPECGATNLGFGVDVYEFGKFRLGGVAEENEADVSIQSKNPSFRINVGEFVVGCHKVGHYSYEDIWECFPGNRRGIRTLFESQMTFGYTSEPSEVSGNKFILAHLGNAVDGLCAVYICQAKRLDRRGKVAEWEFVHELWKREAATGPSPKRQIERVPAEHVGDPVLKLKPKDGDNLHG